MFLGNEWRWVPSAKPFIYASAAAAVIFFISAALFAGLLAGIHTYASFPTALADSDQSATESDAAGKAADIPKSAVSKSRFATINLAWAENATPTTVDADRTSRKRDFQNTRVEKLAAKIRAARADASGTSNHRSSMTVKSVVATDAVKSQPTFTTVCVRHCDGFFFSINQSAKQNDFAKDEAKCWSSCDVPTSLYVYPTEAGSLETMVDSLGRQYQKSETAFLFRTAYKPICSCRGNAQVFSARSRHNSSLRNELPRVSSKKPVKPKTLAALDQRPLNGAKLLSDETARTIPLPTTKPEVTKLIRRLLKRAKLKAEKKKTKAQAIKARKIKKATKRKKTYVKRKKLPKKMALSGKSAKPAKSRAKKISKKPRRIRTANEIIMATMWSQL